MSVEAIKTDVLALHCEISCQYKELSARLDEDTAGNHEIGDQLIELLDIYGNVFHCSRATAYQRIAAESACSY